MNDIIILGATSNICKIRVFNNLNTIYHLINKIYCFCDKNGLLKSFLIILIIMLP